MRGRHPAADARSHCHGGATSKDPSKRPVGRAATARGASTTGPTQRVDPKARLGRAPPASDAEGRMAWWAQDIVPSPRGEEASRRRLRRRRPHPHAPHAKHGGRARRAPAALPATLPEERPQRQQAARQRHPRAWPAKARRPHTLRRHFPLQGPPGAPHGSSRSPSRLWSLPSSAVWNICGLPPPRAGVGGDGAAAKGRVGSKRNLRRKSRGWSWGLQ